MNTSFDIARIISEYGLAILIPLAILEGPIVTIVAGYLISLSLLNPYAAFVVVVVGDVIGDCILWYIGRGGAKGIGRYLGPRFRLSRKQLLSLVRGFRRNGGRLLIAGKLTHAAGFAVLLAAGAARYPLPAFIGFNLLTSLPKSVALLTIGYLFGAAHERMSAWISAGSWTLLGLMLMGGGLFWITRRRRAAS